MKQGRLRTGLKILAAIPIGALMIGSLWVVIGVPVGMIMEGEKISLLAAIGVYVGVAVVVTSLIGLLTLCGMVLYGDFDKE